MSIRCLFTGTINRITCKHNLILFKNCKYKQYSVFSEKSHSIVSMDIDTNISQNAKTELLQIFDASVTSVLPGILIKDKVQIVDDKIIINGNPYTITKNVYIVGFGKAVAGMAYVLEKLLGSRLKKGIISVPRTSLQKNSFSDAIPELKGFQEKRKIQEKNLEELRSSKLIEYCEAAENNQPDNDSLLNTEKIIELVRNLHQDDTLIVLISGGGSALLFQPKSPLTSEFKRDLCSKLQNAGASITELNSVRKQLSNVKGGGLVKIAYPTRTLALILSDVVGDPIEFIASGPTCPNFDGDKAVTILQKYNLYDTLEEDVKNLLFQKNQNNSVEGDRISIDELYKHVENIIIGNNATALHTAAKTAKQFNLESIVLSNTVEGNIKDVSIAYAKLIKSICYALAKQSSSKENLITDTLKQNIKVLKVASNKLEEAFDIIDALGKGKGILLLAGGEPTVIVKGNGKGGRNQELALRFSLDWLYEISKNPHLAEYFVLFLSVGSDGQDGPTDATGAFSQPSIRPKMMKMLQDIKQKIKFTLIPKQLEDLNSKLNQIEKFMPENVLDRNDSYNFYCKYEKGENLVKIGLTGTNVMDLHFIYIKKRECECNIPGHSEEDKNRGMSEELNFLFDEIKR